MASISGYDVGATLGAVTNLVGRRVGWSSEGAAAASAAVKRRGAASRKTKLQASAPEEDTPARRTGRRIRTVTVSGGATTNSRRLEEILEPGLDPLGEAVHARTRERPVPAAGRREARGRAMRAVESETNHCGEARGIHGVAQPADVLRRRADPDSGAEHIRGELAYTFHRRRG